MSDSPRSDTSVCDACSEFHHLLRNREYKDEKFKEIAEAYDVLITPDKRSTYDRFGEEGLKGNNGGGRRHRYEVFHYLYDVQHNLF